MAGRRDRDTPDYPSGVDRKPPSVTDLEAACDAVHENTPEGWCVGQPMEHPERAEWSMYAFDPSEKPIVGKRSREWTAVGQTELHCVQEMADCLAELKAGRWPKSDSRMGTDMGTDPTTTAP